MMKPGLPPPVTYEQVYLAAILDELRAIRAILSADGPPDVSAYGADVILRERRRKPKAKPEAAEV